MKYEKENMFEIKNCPSMDPRQTQTHRDQRLHSESVVAQTQTRSYRYNCISGMRVTLRICVCVCLSLSALASWTITEFLLPLPIHVSNILYFYFYFYSIFEFSLHAEVDVDVDVDVDVAGDVSNVSLAFHTFVRCVGFPSFPSLFHSPPALLFKT